MNLSAQIYRKLIWSAIILIVITAVGTFGYWFITNRQYSIMDAFYMTFITIATIGYGEIIDLSGNTGGRLFTVFIAVAGIGVLAYVATNVTALLVEGELTNSFRRRKMENRARDLKGHYLVCGMSLVGSHVVNELHATGRPFVVIDVTGNEEKILETLKEAIFLKGDATDDDLLLKAGIRQAKGLFAVTNDDNENLAICLTARQLSPSLRIAACCNEPRNANKMTRAGADAVVSPGLIGGMRIASEMIRPTVVSFLDIMLRDREKNLRVEEVPIPTSFSGKTVSALGLKNYPHILLLAVKNKQDWVYNPPNDHVLRDENTLIIMTDVEGRQDLEKFLQDA